MNLIVSFQHLLLESPSLLHWFEVLPLQVFAYETLTISVCFWMLHSVQLICLVVYTYIITFVCLIILGFILPFCE